MLRGIVLFVLFVVMVCLGVSAQTYLIMLIDPTSVFIVVLGGLALLYLAFPLSDWCEAIGFVFSGAKELPKGKRYKLTQIYKAAGEFFLYCGVLGTIIGWILMLLNINDPTTIGPRLSVAMITMVYGLSAYLFTLLLQCKVSLCRVNQEQYELKPHNTYVSFPVALVVFLAVIILGIEQGGSLPPFFDSASFLLVVGGGILAALLCSGPGGLGCAIKTAFSSQEAPLEDVKKGLKVYNLFNDSVVFMFIVAFMVAVIYELQVNFDPSTIGPQVATIMLSLMYGIILISFFRGFSFVLQRKTGATNEEVGVNPFFSHKFIFSYSVFITVLIWGLLLSTMHD